MGSMCPLAIHQFKKIMRDFSSGNLKAWGPILAPWLDRCRYICAVDLKMLLLFLYIYIGSKKQDNDSEWFLESCLAFEPFLIVMVYVGSRGYFMIFLCIFALMDG